MNTNDFDLVQRINRNIENLNRLLSPISKYFEYMHKKELEKDREKRKKQKEKTRRS